MPARQHRPNCRSALLRAGAIKTELVDAVGLCRQVRMTSDADSRLAAGQPGHRCRASQRLSLDMACLKIGRTCTHDQRKPRFALDLQAIKAIGATP